MMYRIKNEATGGVDSNIILMYINQALWALSPTRQNEKSHNLLILTFTASWRILIFEYILC